MTGAADRGDSQRSDPLGSLRQLLHGVLKEATHDSEGRVEIPLPDGLTKLFIGSEPRASGPTRLYVGALLPPDGLISAPGLSRAFGGGSVVRNGGRKELHQFSPYGPADVQSIPRETTDWFVDRIRNAWAIARQSSSAADGAREADKPNMAMEALPPQLVVLEAKAAELREPVGPQPDAATDANVLIVAELRREVEALRRDRDETQQLLVFADTEVADLRAALDAAEQRARHAARAAAEAEAETVRAREQATRQSPEEGTLDVNQFTDEITAILELAMREREADATTITVLERAHRLLGGDARVAVLLGRRYLDVGRPADAIQTLASQAGVVVSPIAAALLVEAHLAERRLPEASLLERADWGASHAANLLISADWFTSDAVVAMAPALASNPMAGLGEWFERMADDMPADALQRLMDAWRAHDPQQTARWLVTAVESHSVSDDAPWVVDGLRAALELGEESLVGRTITALLGVARKSGDVAQLNQLASVWRRRLTGRERLLTGVRLAIAQADLRGGATADEDQAQVLADLYWEAKRQRDESSLKETLALVDRTRATASASVLALLEQCHQPDASQPAGPAQPVSSVSEALEYVRQKYPELVVLTEAVDSARERGARGYKAVLKSLEALGKVAHDYAHDSLGSSVQEACRLLPGFREDISDSAKQEFRADYERRLPDGRLVMLGPHINGGLKDGRIYFHIDEKLRRLVVGHVGRHLRGAQDT